MKITLQYIPSNFKLDQFVGATLDEAKAALIALAHLQVHCLQFSMPFLILELNLHAQAPVLNEWMKAGSLEWFNRDFLFLSEETYLHNFGPFIKSQGARLPPEDAEYLTWYGTQHRGWSSDLRPPLGLCHHDYRTDNLIFPSPDHCVAVDWQTLRWGPAMRDAS